MAYCKTKTYQQLKNIADRAYTRAMGSQTSIDWDAFEELELEAADYAEQHEDEIEWSEIS